MRDGIVYGALIGLGFNWYEAALYVVQTYAEHGRAAFGLQLGARYGLFGLGGHALYTAIFGAFLGFVMQTRYTLLRVAAPLVGLVLAILAHMVQQHAAADGDACPRSPRASRCRKVPESPAGMGFFAAFAEATWLDLVVYWPLHSVDGAGGVAQRRMGAPRHPRATGRRSRARGHPGRIPGHPARRHASNPPHQLQPAAHLRGIGERATRTRIPQMARRQAKATIRRPIRWSRAGARTSHACARCCGHDQHSKRATRSASLAVGSRRIAHVFG